MSVTLGRHRRVARLCSLITDSSPPVEKAMRMQSVHIGDIKLVSQGFKWPSPRAVIGIVLVPAANETLSMRPGRDPSVATIRKSEMPAGTTGSCEHGCEDPGHFVTGVTTGRRPQQVPFSVSGFGAQIFTIRHKTPGLKEGVLLSEIGGSPCGDGATANGRLREAFLRNWKCSVLFWSPPDN